MMDTWLLAQVRHRELLEEAERARLARQAAEQRKHRGRHLLPLALWR